jgi:maltose/moltooligosaccharide transporter
VSEKLLPQHAVTAAPMPSSRRRRKAVLLGAGLVSLLPLYCFLLLGDMAWSLKERAVQELVKAQLRDFSQNPLLLNFLFGVLPALLSLTFGPAICAWSDRTRTRLGRRIPFLLAIAPLLAASLAGLAFAQPLADYFLRQFGGGLLQRDHAVVLCMSVFWALFELFSILSNALFIALINDTVPRAVLGRFFGAFRIASLAVGASFFYFIFGNDVTAVASSVMLAIAVIFVLAFTVIGVAVREPAYPPPAATRHRIFGGLRGEGRADLSFYLLLFAALGIATICVLPVNINAFNAISQFGVDRTTFGNAIAATYCMSILLAAPLGWLADRVHPLRIGLVTLALYAVFMLFAWFFVGGRASFQFWLVVHGVLAGCFLSGTAPLLSRLLPRERFSELAAFSASVTAVLAVGFSLGTGAVLQWSGRDFRLIFLVASAGAALGTALWVALMRAHQRRVQANLPG